MSQALASPADCHNPCADVPAQQLVGPQGKSAYQVAVDQGFVGTEAEWLASLDGADGLNAFTDLSAAFTVPDAATPDVAEVVNSDWAVVGQIIFLEGGGYFTVASVPDSTHIELDNTDYPGNAADGTIVASGSHLGPAGIRGAAGAGGGGGGDLLSANNLSDVADADTSLTNLGGSVTGVNIFKVASPSAIRFLRVNANNTVSLLSDSDQRTALGLAVGANVQAFDADLTAIAALVSAADQVPYATGAGTWALFTATSEGRNLLAQTTVALMRSVLEVLPRYGLLASKIGVDFNIAANDNSVQVASSRYRIDRITVDNASVSLTTATLGVFTEPAAGGTTIMTDQGLAALNATTKFTDPGLAGIVATDVLTDTVLYLRVGTAQGSDATGNVFIFGWSLE